jgi:rhodanese-related sulfurtransferase
MVQIIPPNAVQALIESGSVDVVDVREPREWSTGHIPHARLVPLDELRANPETALGRDGVVFVCAKGVRSLAAAKLAERLGFSHLYSLDGGTSNWVRAGLPLES